MIPIVAGLAGLGLGAYTGAQVDDALDQGSGGGFGGGSLVIGLVLVAVVYIVVKNKL